MPIVTREELHEYMSEPEWSPVQKNAAKNILAGLESQLESKLFGAPITARDPVTEVAAITPRGGIVMTEYPVFSVSLIGGTVVDDAHPLAAPYSIRDGYVRIGPTSTDDLITFPTYPGTRGLAAITLTYRPGWGPVEALRLAIMDKAAIIMQNYHDDTMVARATDGQRLPQLPPREWTQSEVDALGAFRNLFLVL